MKNTKFRRRALISSVAMLLVALVALGSATFAWFSADPNAKTNGLNMKAQSSTGLLIQSESEQAYITTHSSTMTGDYWSHEAVLNATNYTNNAFVTGSAIARGAASQDASSGTSAVHGIYRIDAEKDNASAADTNKSVTESDKTKDHFEEKLYLKVTGAASASVDLKKVTFTNTNTDLGKAIRVAVLSSDLKTLYGIWKPSTGATNNKYLSATGTYAQSASAYSALASGSDQTISIGSIGNDGSNYVVVRVYIDGEDAKVYSLNITQADLSSILSSVVVEFKIHE